MTDDTSKHTPSIWRNPGRVCRRQTWIPSMAAFAFFAGGAFTTPSTTLAAKDLKPYQEEAKERFDKEMEKPLKAMNDACGTSMTLTADYENYDREVWGKKSHATWCAPMLSQIQGMCKSSAAYKKAIATRIKSVACLFSGVKPQKKGESRNDFTLRNMTLEGDAFVFRRDVNSVNISYVTKDALDKALNE